MLHKHSSPDGDAFVRIANKIKEFADRRNETIARKGKLRPRTRDHLIFAAQRTMRQSFKILTVAKWTLVSKVAELPGALHPSTIRP